MFAQKIAYLYLVLLVSGCAHRDAPLATPYAAPPGWSTIATASQDTQSTSGAPTWPAGDDAVLASLLERLECDNLELQSAAARLAASSAIADFAAAQRRPWLNVTVEGTRQRVPRTTFRDGEGQRHSIPPYRQSGYNAQLVLGYEIDLFGRLNHLQAGAEAGHAARAADLDSLRQRLRLETRLAFLALRHAESLIKENVAATTLLQRRIALLDARLDAGLIAIDTLRPIREALAVTQRDAAALRAERHVAHSRIAVLLGTPPAALSLPPDTETSGSTESLPGVPGSVPAELPATVIARRPDIAAAWQNSLAASHDRERVRSERWPQLTLTSASASATLAQWQTALRTVTYTNTSDNPNTASRTLNVTVSDGTSSSIAATRAVTVAAVNDAPTVANAVPDQTASEGSAFNFQFAANTFADVDVGDTLSYTAQLAGGGALPAWLTFDPGTRTFSGTPANVGTVSIEVVADDGHGGTVSDRFELVIGAAPVDPGPDPVPPVTPPVLPPTPGIPDNDGVPSTVEDQAPGIPGPGGVIVAGDGNGDGIKDSQQAEVASIIFLLSPTVQTNPGNAAPTFTTLVTSSQDGKVGSGNDNSRILSLQQLDAPQDVPGGMQTPLGLVSFTVALAASKTGENFSLYLDPALGINGYWKQDASGTWVNLASEPYGGKMVMEGGRLRLDFRIEDGGQFDADGKADGIITDPGAPAYLPLSIVGHAPELFDRGFWF